MCTKRGSGKLLWTMLWVEGKPQTDVAFDNLQHFQRDSREKVRFLQKALGEKQKVAYLDGWMDERFLSLGCCVVFTNGNELIMSRFRYDLPIVNKIEKLKTALIHRLQ